MSMAVAAEETTFVSFLPMSRWTHLKSVVQWGGCSMLPESLVIRDNLTVEKLL